MRRERPEQQAPPERAPRPEPRRGAAAGAPPESMKPRMSFFVTRPPRPVPGTWPTSTLCSAAIRATTGETNAFSAVLGRSGGGCRSLGDRRGRDLGRRVGRLGRCGLGLGGSAAGGSSAAGVSAAGASGAGASAVAASEPSGPITASTVPTSTVSPSCTRIFWSTPVAGLGTSVSTLSVEISSSDSSAAIVSPGCFSHLVIVPSETETPIWGITTSTAV